MAWKKNGRILAIDYGLKRVGLAICDESQIVISPLPQLENDQFFKKKLAAIVLEKKPIRIVLGYPMHERSDNTIQENPFIRELYKFRNYLEKNYLNIPVINFDESFSTRTAMEYIGNIEGIANSPKKRKKKKRKLDSFAAGLLLESYLKTKH